MDKKNCIVIAAGGTGGHVFPSIGLANYLMKDYDIDSWEIGKIVQKNNSTISKFLPEILT